MEDITGKCICVRGSLQLHLIVSNQVLTHPNAIVKSDWKKTRITFKYLIYEFPGAPQLGRIHWNNFVIRIKAVLCLCIIQMKSIIGSVSLSFLSAFSVGAEI